jgi:hypothetical protein
MESSFGIVGAAVRRVYGRPGVASRGEATRSPGPRERRNVYVTATTADNSGQPVEIGSMVAEEMERWLSEMEGFEGFLLLTGEEKSMGLAFWASRELAERHAVARAEFRERMLALVGVRIEEVVDYDVAFARVRPGFIAEAASGGGA